MKLRYMLQYPFSFHNSEANKEQSISIGRMPKPMVEISQRVLCPYCHGENEYCSKCNGGWIGLPEAESGPSPRRVKVKRERSKTVNGHKRRSLRTAEEDRERPPQISLNQKYELLIQATKEVKRVEQISGLPTLTVVKTARAAFRSIKKILSNCKTDELRASVKTQLNKAYYLLKRAEDQQRAEGQLTGTNGRQPRVYQVPSKEVSSKPKKPRVGPLSKKATATQGHPTATQSKKKKKPKRHRSVWTISGGGFETNRRKH